MSEPTPVSLEAQLCEALFVLESIADALDKRPVSDFMASIPIVRRVMDLIAAHDFCIHCLGPIERSGKCKNDYCIGAEYSFENPDGWPAE